MLANAAQVTAVIRPGLTGVIRAGRARRTVVGWISVRKAVGHDEVDNVVARKALEVSAGVSADVSARICTSQEGQLHDRSSCRSDQPQRHGSRLQIETQLEVDEEIMSITGSFRANHGYTLRRALHPGGIQIFTCQQKRKFGRVVHPPVGRIDFADCGNLPRPGIRLRACRQREQA